MSVPSCDFCSTVVADAFGTASGWGIDDIVEETICIDCAIKDKGGMKVCDECGLEAPAPAYLASYGVEVGHLEGRIRRCPYCAPLDDSIARVKELPSGYLMEG